ncbi:DUF885 domain-containing protein [Paremcibacter congregatus]|uniref:DUF885 domain-containing protein n=1 Tax=Paremcibacter congregatus TaxID=2043170 RepID=UPI003A94C6A2
MKKAVLSAALWVTLGLASTPSAWADDTQDFKKILDDHWHQSLTESPTFASELGDRSANGRLSENSPLARQRRQDFNDALLTRLAGVKAIELTPQDQVNYKVFLRLRQMEKESYRHPDYLFPITNREGWHMFFAQTPASLPFMEAADYEHYLGLLADYPRYNAENMAVLAEAVEKGYTHYCTSMKGYETSISTHIVEDVTTSAFYSPFTRFPANMSEAQQKKVTERGIALITEKVIPAYQLLYKLYTEKYAPACRKTVGITSLPGGKEYYSYLIRNFTTTDLSPRQIHDTGLSEVKRLRGEMDKIIKKVGFKGTFPEFLVFLRTDPRFYAESPTDLMEKVALITKRMDGQLPKLFGYLPRNPYGLMEIPSDIAEKTTAAYYMPSQGDGSKSAGNYYINTSLLKSRPLYGLEALSYHEAVPGHHLQGAIQKEMDLPNFRKYHYFNAYGEGWALYAERLGLEVGFYTDPYSDFGRLTYEMWRACRLVVDTGMHAFGWSRQQAIDFMAENTSLSLHEITTEVDRYITWPGQALAYKLGELSITALRREAEQRLGDQFDIRAFHDMILGNGSLPIAVMEDLARDWMAAQEAKNIKHAQNNEQN